jgi:Tol biopolymer transport system component
VDGKEGPEYDGIGLSYTVFSPDGKRLVYGAKKADKWFVVLDGEVCPESGYDDVGFFDFSPDSSRFAYAALKDDKRYMVVDGRVGKTYERVSEPVFSPDGKHLAYIATIKDAEPDKKRRFIVLDGKEGKIYDGVNRPIFSKDSEHIMYGVMEGDYRMVVVDGNEGPKYKMEPPIGFLTFGPNDSRIAYVVINSNHKVVVVMNGQEGPEYNGILDSGVVLSPNGESFAYTAKKGNGWLVVADGNEGPIYDGIAIGSPVFSPDGYNLAYAAVKDNQWFVVLNGQPIQYDCNDISPILFSPDGRHIIHTIQKDNRWFLVIDGEIKSDYEHIYELNPAADAVEYTADSDGWLFRCRQNYSSTDGSKLIQEEIYRYSP